MRNSIIFILLINANCLLSQNRNIDIETLWSLKRINISGISPDGHTLVYSTVSYHLDSGHSSTNTYALDLRNGQKEILLNKAHPGSFVGFYNDQVVIKRENRLLSKKINGSAEQVYSQLDENADNIILDPASDQILYSKKVLLRPTHSMNLYPKLTKGDVYVFDELNDRHWDSWENGWINHFHLAKVDKLRNGGRDILKDEPYASPQTPFGGTDDACFSRDGKYIFYVCKKKSGTAYALSTNTDIYQYEIATGTTRNLTEGMMGYDRNPILNPDGRFLAFTSMKTESFEADKEDIILVDLSSGQKRNLTASWDGTVDLSLIHI